MNKWSLTLVAAASALALQACDVQVNDNTARQGSGAVSESSATTESAASTAPATDPSAGTSSTTVASGASSSTAAPAEASPSMASPPLESPVVQSPPLSPDTSAMGGPAPATGAAPGAMPAGVAPMTMPADTTAGGVAAPTELARFLEQHPPGVRKQEQAASKTDGGKSEAAKPEKAEKAEKKADAAKGDKKS
ncbi:MAG TPA: hypothetical protein VHL79_19620 [Ramlibacter sp.]|jgi:hypothetical protein|nr:hypothetical protein [Ramlibacter sp.]